MARISEKKFKKVKENYRKEYPGVDLFFTEDGNCFLKKNMADAHARQEKLKVIPDLVSQPVKAEEPKGDNKKGGESDEGEMTEEQAKEKLAEITLDENADHHLLGDIIGALDVEVKGKSKEDRINALKPVQDELKGE